MNAPKDPRYIYDDMGPCGFVDFQASEPSAEHIAMCVDSHDELVAALRELLTFSEFLKISGAPEPLLDFVSAKNNADALLAKLEETP